MKLPFKKKTFNNADEFLMDVLNLGTPIDTSLVGNFDEEGRGSRRDIDLPFHRDGDYTTKYKGMIDVVALYCIREGNVETLIELPGGGIKRFNLKKNECLIINNKTCRHGRTGTVGNRLLLRVWIKSKIA